jgi:hypothetical protein
MRQGRASGLHWGGHRLEGLAPGPLLWAPPSLFLRQTGSKWAACWAGPWAEFQVPVTERATVTRRPQVPGCHVRNLIRWPPDSHCVNLHPFSTPESTFQTFQRHNQPF